MYTLTLLVIVHCIDEYMYQFCNYKFIFSVKYKVPFTMKSINDLHENMYLQQYQIPKQSDFKLILYSYCRNPNLAGINEDLSINILYIPLCKCYIIWTMYIYNIHGQMYLTFSINSFYIEYDTILTDTRSSIF